MYPKGCVAGLAIGLSALSFISKAEAKQSVKPNILYILTDDQRYDSISAFNKILTNKNDSPLGHVESPNVDRLAAQGTTFINTWVHAQGCAPSRASMLLGRYPHRSGVYEFEWHNNTVEHWKPNMPEALKTFGYQTLHIGKLGVRTRTIRNGKVGEYDKGYDTDVYFSELRKAGLTDWTKESLSEIDGIKFEGKKEQVDFFYKPDGTYDYVAKAFNKMKGMENHNREIEKKYDILRMYDKKAKEQTYGSGEIIAGVSCQPAGKTRDGYYPKALNTYLNAPNKKFEMGNKKYNGVNPEKPVFIHLGFDFPHTPVLPPKSWREKFKKYKYNIPKFDKKEHLKLPEQLRKKLVEKKFSNHFTDEEKQRMVQDYYAFCAYGDDLVGQAYDAFVKYSEKNKQPWMVIYVCGDHGWKLNEHGAVYKFSPWKEDSNNPIIVVSSDKKAFPAGKVVNDFTEFVDIMPTALAAAGADLKDEKFSFLDGYDLAKVVSKEIPARDYIIEESHAVTGPRATIRTKNFMFSMKIRPQNQMGGKDVKWAINSSYKDIEPLMYNTRKDPNEAHNIAFDKEYEKIALYLREKLQNILLGDGRVEVKWGKKGDGTDVSISNFAKGADDKKIDFKGSKL